MCVILKRGTKLQTTKRTRFVFKYVTNTAEGYASYHPSFSRAKQPRIERLGKSYVQYQSTLGTVLSYRIGESVTSRFPETPGIYCYRNFREIQSVVEHLDDCFAAVLRCEIPKGTRILRGTAPPCYLGEGCEIILAETIIPIEQVYEK